MSLFDLLLSMVLILIDLDAHVKTAITQGSLRLMKLEIILFFMVFVLITKGGYGMERSLLGSLLVVRLRT